MFELEKDIIDECCDDTSSLDKWKGSKWENFIFNHSGTQRGKKAEIIFSKILDHFGIDYTKVSSTKDGYDFIINGEKVELKYSSEDKNKHFNFLQVRVEDDRYDSIVFFFVYPSGESFYYVNKQHLNLFKTSSAHSGQKNACCLQATKKNMDVFNLFGNGSIEDVVKNWIWNINKLWGWIRFDWVYLVKGSGSGWSWSL